MSFLGLRLTAPITINPRAVNRWPTNLNKGCERRLSSVEESILWPAGLEISDRNDKKKGFLQSEI